MSTIPLTTPTKFELAPQDRIDAYERTAREFMREILDINYDECLVTDESRLSDFSGCGIPDEIGEGLTEMRALYDAWDAWVVPVICTRYGLVTSELQTTVRLVDLFEQIEQLERAGPHRLQ